VKDVAFKKIAFLSCDKRNTVIGGGAGNFLGVRRQRIFCLNFSKFAPKNLCEKLYLYKFSVALGALYFSLPCCHRFENRIFGTWNWVLNHPTEKKYDRLCKNIVRSQRAQYSWAPTSQFWGFPFTFQLLLSARNIRPSWGKPKATSFSADICDVYMVCIILFMLWLCRESYKIVYSTALIFNMQQTLAKCVNPLYSLEVIEK